jgi:hypothetical protein
MGALKARMVVSWEASKTGGVLRRLLRLGISRPFTDRRSATATVSLAKRY